MSKDPSKEQALRDLERRLDRRVRYEHKIVFDIQRKEGCQGEIKNLSRSGAFIVSDEFLFTGTALTLHLVMIKMGEALEIILLGKVIRVDRTVPEPLRGYGIAFDDENPEIVKKALDTLLTEMENGPAMGRTPVAAKAMQGGEEEVEEESLLKTASSIEKRAKKAMPPKSSVETHVTPKSFKTLPIGMGVLGVLLLILVVGYFQNSSLKGNFPKGIDIHKVEVEGRDLTVIVKDSWVKSTNKADRKLVFDLIADKFMSKSQVQSITFLDPKDQTLGMILFVQTGSGREVSVRVN